MGQFSFFAFLYVLGVAFSTLWKDRIPVYVLSASGFLWGAMLWGFSVILWLFVPVVAFEQLPIVMTLTIGGCIAFMHIRNGTLRITNAESLSIGLIGVSFFAGCLVLTQFDYTQVSPDSLSYVMQGHLIPKRGLTDALAFHFTLRNVMLQAFHSGSAIAQVTYLHSLHAVFSLALAFTFTSVLYCALISLSVQKRSAGLYSLAGTLLLFCQYPALLNSFYIHSNWISGIYLFTAVTFFWFYLHNDGDASWGLLGVLALIVFSLLRSEGVLFSAIFLALVIKSRNQINIILLYVVVLGIWYGILLTWTSSESYILSPFNVALILFVLFGLLILSVADQFSSIVSMLRKRIDFVMLWGGSIVLFITFVLKPAHMFISTTRMVYNMLDLTYWGLTWVIAIILLFGASRFRFPKDEVFKAGTVVFFLLLVSLAFVRAPYRIGWSDSANRILLHILPLVLFYLLMKYRRLFVTGSEILNDPK